jgi:VanZ family protein
MLTFPYLGLPLYLVVCALLLCFLPTGRPGGSFPFGGLYRTLPALLLAGAIFVASSFTLPSGPPTLALPDVGFHFVEFFALGLLTARMVTPNLQNGLSLRSFLLVLSIVVGYALLDEIHQSFVPGRDPSWADLVADASGGLLGILVYPVLFTGPAESP